MRKVVGGTHPLSCRPAHAPAVEVLTVIQSILPRSPYTVRVVGAGAFVPAQVVDNGRITRAIPAWEPSWIERKTSIRERRFLWDIDEEAGVTVAPAAAGGPQTNTDMCEIALRGAMDMAGLRGTDLDAVFVVTCTPDRLNFSYDAMELHRRFACRTDTYGMVVDDGCGGTPYVIDMAYRMIRTGALRTVAVVGSACTSPLLNRDVWTGAVQPTGDGKPLNAALSMYVFGDGAGAVVLRGDCAPGEGIIASMSGNDYQELVIRRAGGVLARIGGASSPADDAFVVDGRLVAESYPVFMNRCLDALFAEHPELSDQVRRYYFHQPNKRLMDTFVDGAGLARERVPYNVDRYGNTSAAGMLVLLAEDLEQGVVRLGSGDLVVIAAVGANVHYGGQLLRL
jgi:3-oxoacyl-[acyl-carrier-protein] synthase III